MSSSSPASHPTPSLLATFPAGLFPRFLTEDKTVPGTTEGILLMGIVIVLIIIIPIIVTRRKWMR